MSKYTPTIDLFRLHHFGDWLMMTRSPQCTFNDKGMLIDALDLYWLGSCHGLPAEPSELAKMLGSTVEEAISLLEHTSGYEVIDGRIHWEKENDRFNDAMKRRQENSKNGKKGGRAPRGSDRLPNANQPLSQPVTINQEPLTITQEPECVSTVEEVIPFKAAKQVLE